MIVLYLLILLFLALATAALSYFAGLRAVGVKPSLAVTMKLSVILLAFQTLVTLISYLLGENPVIFIVWLGWLIGGFLIWHKLLEHYYRIKIGKSLTSYLIAGFIITILSVIVAIGATSVVQSYKIEGNIMSPKLSHGDTVLTYKVGKKLNVNKIVIYHHKTDGKSGTTIGRILYTPGQTVSIKSKYIDVNGTFAEPSEYKLKEKEYYILGDNQANTLPRIIAEENIVSVVGPTILKAD